MPFGFSGTVKTHQETRSTDFATNVAELPNSNGEIAEYHTYGGTKTEKDDYFLASDETFSNEALPGQTGTGYVSAMSLTESAKDYQKVSRTKITALYTTTTTTTAAASSSGE